MGDTQKRRQLIWEKLGTTSQRRQHFNKVLQSLKGLNSGAEWGEGWREEENFRMIEDVTKGKDVKGPGEE